jgi:hypothetical protein
LPRQEPKYLYRHRHTYIGGTSAPFKAVRGARPRSMRAAHAVMRAPSLTVNFVEP